MAVNKRSLQDWASVAEILGAAAVVVSLLFVGFQISDGNRETRAATAQAALDSEMSFQAELLRYAGTWEKVTSGLPLSDGEEQRRGIVLYQMMQTLNENRYHQMKSGYLPYEPSALLGAVSWPMYDVWIESGGYQSRSLDYREFLDAERKRLNLE